MTTIIILFLFILQLVSFFLIALLYTKLGKFNELKKQQDQLMREFEDTVGTYLAEIKDENDRLIEELSTLKPDESKPTKEPEFKPSVDFNTPILSKRAVPKSKAVTTYQKMAANPEVVEKEKTKEETALELSESGYSIEEIAKRLRMGKTEVELLIKFRG